MQDDFTTATASGEEDAALDPEELDALEEERTSVREAVLLSPDVLAFHGDYGEPEHFPYD